MLEFVKRFSEWFIMKPALDKGCHRPPAFNEREVWWCSIGENIGIEISGKGKYFRRPVLVFRKLDAYSFIGMPLTRTERTGDWYEKLSIGGRSNTIILAQTRHFDYRRMDKILCTISDSDFKGIRRSYIRLFPENRSPA